MSEKKQMIKKYITQIASKVNEQYQGLIDDNKMSKAIAMFTDSTEEYDTIVQRINELVNQVIQNYLKEQEKRFDPKLVKENHEEIYSKLEVLIRKLNEKDVDYQLAGALCAYIKYGVESNRTHDDIDINLNEADMSKFKEVCEEMGLQFHDNRLTTPRILKNGIPYGEHEVIATLDGSDFHIGAFCFERKPDGTVINKGYYHDENGQIFSRNDIISPQLASEIFGKEQAIFRGQRLFITPPEYIYKLKSYTHNSKDKVDLLFMENRIDRNKLARINELSKASHVEHQKIKPNSSILFQNFNYHTHTYRSGHSKYISDEEILETAKQMGFTSLGFSEHIPNPSLVLPDEDHRMLLSEVDEYIASINKLKQDNPNMTILAGFEAEFDPIQESFLGELREKVDYMVLGQHFVENGLTKVQTKGNPNYPIEYAAMISKAIDSGIFDIVAHPDIFMEIRDTMTDEQSKKLFDENSVIASQIICEKARDMGIPIEINLGGINNNQILLDGNLSYPHPIFWKVASEIDGLQIIQGIDVHDYLKTFEQVDEFSVSISNIISLVQDKIITSEYNPVVARQNNSKLQDAYKLGQANALTFETHMVNQMLSRISSRIPQDTDIFTTIMDMEKGLDMTIQNCIYDARKKDESIVEELSTISEYNKISITEKKRKIDRKKKALEETNRVLANQQKIIETAKGTIKNAVDMGCETKEEISNISTQITEHNTTNDNQKKITIEQSISNFQQSKGMSNGHTETKGQPYQLKRTDNSNNGNNNTNHGFINVVTLSLVVAFTIGIAVGIGYMLFKLSIGG